MDWFFEADIRHLRAIVPSYPFDPDPDVLESHLLALSGLLKNGECKVHWPISIVTAMEKKQPKVLLTTKEWSKARLEMQNKRPSIVEMSSKQKVMKVAKEQPEMSPVVELSTCIVQY